MNSAEIVKMFSERANEHGTTMLTKKQVCWLMGKWEEEGGRRHSNRPVSIPDTSKKYYRLTIFPNGGGFLQAQ